LQPNVVNENVINRVQNYYKKRTYANFREK
jgi:hypothetical protein